jgi:hypothetical protein
MKTKTSRRTTAWHFSVVEAIQVGSDKEGVEDVGALVKTWNVTDSPSLHHVNERIRFRSVSLGVVFCGLELELCSRFVMEARG